MGAHTGVTVWTPALAAPSLRVPEADDDKYSRGVLGVRTGSLAYPGAAVLGVEAAWRTGLGMVRFVGPERLGARVLDARPETVLGAGRVQAWLCGSGVDAAGRAPAETAALRELLAGEAPVVVDAGALDLVVSASGSSAAPCVLTPHDREFARLQRAVGLGPGPDADAATGDAPSRALAMRVAQTRALAEALRQTVLRKGATTIVASPGGGCVTVAAATPWLATAGTGDVLGGVLGALVAGAAARGSISHDALRALAASAALVHGVAGRIAAGLQPFVSEVGEANAAERAGVASADTARPDADEGRPITALDVAHALPWAVASVRGATARG